MTTTLQTATISKLEARFLTLFPKHKQLQQQQQQRREMQI